VQGGQLPRLQKIINFDELSRTIDFELGAEIWRGAATSSQFLIKTNVPQFGAQTWWW